VSLQYPSRKREFDVGRVCYRGGDNIGDFKIFVMIERYFFVVLQESALLEHGKILEVGCFKKRARSSRQASARSALDVPRRS
jgi:hypothetical protein